MKVTLMIDGRERSFTEGELTRIVEEYCKKEGTESVRKKTTVGSWLVVNFTTINTKMFETPRKEAKQEEIRLLILEAIEIAKRNENFQNFEIQVLEKKWKSKSYREFKDIARKNEAHIATWVEVALWWATQIQAEQDWEKLCNEKEDCEWYKLAEWKNTLAYIGNCTSSNGKAPATEIFECGFLNRIQICDAVPFLVKSLK